jgi:hypothetical protein
LAICHYGLTETQPAVVGRNQGMEINFETRVAQTPDGSFEKMKILENAAGQTHAAYTFA